MALNFAVQGYLKILLSCTIPLIQQNLLSNTIPLIQQKPVNQINKTCYPN
jgi:hypothetical protein